MPNYNLFLMIHRYSFLLFVLLLASCERENPETLLFERLAAERTGIDFENTITEDDSVNLLNYYYVYNGSGVAVGDFNQDGRPDLFFGGNMVSSGLYLNNGAFSFQDITGEAGVKTSAWIMGVTVVDINADGLDDIYLSVAGPPRKNQSMENLLFVNLGPDADGIPHFEEAAAQYGINDDSFSVQSAFVDYDRDGDLDLFVLTNRVDEIDKSLVQDSRQAITDGETIDRLYENLGDIRGQGNDFFQLRDTTSGIKREGYGLGVAIDDLNGDNWPDIYVANDFMPDDLLYLNQKNGSFKEDGHQVLSTQSYNGMGVDIADVNNDLLPDIMVLDMMPDNNDRRKSMIAGMEAKKFGLRQEAGYQAQYIRNTLQLNRGTDQTGTAHFMDVAQLAGIHATDWSWAPLMADFDNDGDQDIFITNGFVKDMTDLDYINFQANNSYFGTKAAKQDRNLNLMNAMKEVKIPNFLYQNQGELVFKDVSESSGVGIPSFSNGAVYADLDNDGDLDLVTNDINSTALVYENKNKTKNNYLKITLEFPGKNIRGIGAKVRVKGTNTSKYLYVSPTRGYLSSVESNLHLGLGTDTIVQSIEVTWPDGRQQQLVDVPVNQQLLIRYQPGMAPAEYSAALGSWYSPKPDLIDFTHRENTFNDFDHDPLLLKRYSCSGPGMSIGDINGDQREDLFIGGAAGHPAALFLQHQSGAFRQSFLPAGAEVYEDVASLFFDVDGDQDQDLYVVSGGSEFSAGSEHYQDRLYLNDGQGNFTAATPLPAMHTGGSCISGADFDQDGDIDLFRGSDFFPGKYPSSPRQHLWLNEGGTYRDITDEIPGLSELGMVSSALWSDYDNDGWLDLLVVGEWLPLTIFRNEQGKLKKVNLPGLANSTGWWNVLKAGDFDNDGDVDYVAGNQGINQDYQAGADRPFSLYAADFDQNGKIDPIFATYLKDRMGGEIYQFPFHGRNDLNNQIVAFKRLYPSYQDYSEALFDEILTEKDRRAAQLFEAKTFRSSLFINQGDGTFEIQDLPVEAQMSPIHAIVVEDLNQDGHLDMVLAGNSNAAEHTYGAQHNGSGVCLMGKGDNTFTVRVPQESGLFLDEAVQGLEILRSVNGERLLVVAVNDGKLRVFSDKREARDRISLLQNHR